jgi:diguanylate cyclase (GGDEF)-like protein
VSWRLRALGGGIARRVVALFLVCAMVPVVALATLTYVQVRDLFAERARTELARTALDYTSNLHDRLSLADLELRAMAERDGRNAFPFSSVRIASASEAALLEGGTNSVLRAGRGDRGTGRVELVAAGPLAGHGRVLVGLLDREFLWGDAGDLPAGIHLCVHDAAGAQLHCSAPPGLEPDVRELAALTATRSTVAINDASGKAVLAAYREMFLPRFQTARWTIVTWCDEAEALAPAASFRGAYVSVALLALLLVALLSSTQIRRTLVPLHALLAGTRRAAQQDFTTRVVHTGRDEFSQLGDAFNSMNQRLGRQFDTLRILADVDRAILARAEVDRIVEHLLARMRALMPSRYVCIAIFERNGGPMMRAYTLDCRSDAAPSLERMPASGIGEAGWIADPGGVALPCQPQPHPLARLLAQRGARQVLAMPIVAETTVAGALLLGFDGEAVLTADERDTARELGDRLGVAFATAAKDEQLYYQAHYDVLTELPNRLLFKDELARRMAHARRDGRPVALLFIDLDHFKNVNDSAGHAIGDAVLCEAAARLRHCVRSGDALARLGGDEFSVVVSEHGTPRAAEAVARHIVEAMTVPFAVGGADHYLSASIGIAMHPADGLTPEELLRNADTAMYRAKEAGRNRWVYFEECMNTAALARVTIERDLRRALDAGEFRLVYQPQFELGSGRLVAAEALLRWHHRDGSTVLPADFISRAEETGVIERLGLWVLQEAAEQHQRWARAGVVLERLALNVSAQQFRRREFVDAVARVLAATGMPPSCLELEVTESVLMDAGRHVEYALETLDAMRVRIALDDFGTGYSSLAYLKRFPVHVVKIDRAFVADLCAEASSVAIAGAIVGMAHALGKQVVAEGVETRAQADVLARLHCDLAQGYHFARPLAADDFAALARAAAANTAVSV